MLTRTDLRGRVPSTVELRATLPRAEMDVEHVLHRVRPVVEEVRDRVCRPSWTSPRSSTESDRVG